MVHKHSQSWFHKGRTVTAVVASASMALSLAACSDNNNAVNNNAGDGDSVTSSVSSSESASSARFTPSANTIAKSDKVKSAIDELNQLFAEAEGNHDWKPGYYRDVYTRIVDASGRLVEATANSDNPQLELDAKILNDQAKAMLREEPNFEQKERPAQLANRYTRADMQLWRDRLAFALANPDNFRKPNAGIEKVSQAEATANAADLKDLQTYSDNAGGFKVEFTVIPKGSFQMGGDQQEWEAHNVDSYRRDWESPKHTVEINKRYGIMNTEATRKMFAAFVAETGYQTAAGGIGFPPPPETTSSDSSMYREGVTWEEPGIPQENDNNPVVQVSRADAEAFASWLSAKTGETWRLPSEAEWEYAARAGTTTAYFWGDDVNDGAEYAAGYDRRTDEATGYGFTPRMEADDGAAYTNDVASYKPNPWGLYDMTGNAREWVSDYWEPNLQSGPTDQEPRKGGVATFPVLRGGAWDYMPQNLRIAYRSAYYNNYIHSTMWGFRLVREL